MHWLRNAGCALMIGALVACGGNGDEGESDAPTETTTAAGTDDAPSTRAEAQAEDLTIDAFLAALTDAGLPVGESTVYDDTTDPNELLGRPGQYVAKASWIDTRIECLGEDPGVECGGDIELFDNTDDRDDRYEYLAGFAEEAMLGGYYQWKLPNAVIRIGFELTPSQAEEYAAVFEQLAPGEVEQLG